MDGRVGTEKVIWLHVIANAYNEVHMFVKLGSETKHNEPEEISSGPLTGCLSIRSTQGI
jgi:hypothetical protein